MLSKHLLLAVELEADAQEISLLEITYKKKEQPNAKGKNKKYR